MIQVSISWSGIENRVGEFFRYRKESTAIFCHKMGASNNIQVLGTKTYSLTIHSTLSNYKDEKWIKLLIQHYELHHGLYHPYIYNCTELLIASG